MSPDCGVRLAPVQFPSFFHRLSQRGIPLLMPLPFPDFGAAETKRKPKRRRYSKCTFCYQLNDVGRPLLSPFSRHIFGPEKKKEADLGSDTLMCGFREEEQDAQKVPKNDD